MRLDEIQSASAEQFARQSHRYGKQHILADVTDVEAALEYVSLQVGAKALDVATGGGHTGLLLATRGFEVTLGDLAPAMLERASALAQERKLNVAISQFAAEEFPFNDATFDLVTCRVAAHHFSEPGGFVQEVERVLRPGGSFLLIDGSLDDAQPESEAWLHQVEKWRDPSHHRFLSKGNWEKLCVKAGLTVTHSVLQPLKQPDLEWYFETAATPDENRKKVREAIRTVPAKVQAYLRIGEENGRIIWWWPRLTLVARKLESDRCVSNHQ